MQPNKQLYYKNELFDNLMGLQQPIFDRKKAFDFVQTEFSKRFDQTVFAPYGFGNTYALTVRGDVAPKYGLTKVSDLAPYAVNMRLGTDTFFWDREGDSYTVLTQTYGFTFNLTIEYDLRCLPVVNYVDKLRGLVTRSLLVRVIAENL